MFAIHRRRYCRVVSAISFLRAATLSFLATVAGIAAFDCAQAAVNAFSPLGPEGGLVQTIAYHPTDPSIAYLGAVSGFYRSVDAGSSWTLVSHDVWNGPRDIAVNPAHPAQVFVAGGGIYVSEDSGASLLQLSTVGRVDTLDQVEFSADGTVLYAASATRVLRSTDQGHSWTQGAAITSATAYVMSLRVDPHLPNTIYAGTTAGAFRSTDGGATWSSFNAAGSTYVSDIALSRSTPQRIWAAVDTGLWFSDNDGQNWTQSTLIGRADLIAIDPDDESVIYVGEAATGLVRSSDGGATWMPIQTNADTGAITAFARRPDSSAHLLLAGRQGAASTNDAGAHWISCNTGVLAALTHELAASPASDRTYTSSTYGGLHFIEGDGAAEPVNNEPLRQFGYNPVNMSTRGLFVQPGQPDHLLVGVPHGIARSEDGGQTWQLLSSTDLLAYPVIRIAAGSADGEVLIAVAERRIFRSINAGDTWSPVLGVTMERASEALATAPSLPSTLYLGSYAQGSEVPQILKSMDAGVTWNVVASWPSGFILQILVDPRDDRVVYVTTDKGLFRSADGGGSWSELRWASSINEYASAVALDPVDPDILYAANSSRMLRSVDAGLTWELLPAPREIPFWDVRAMSVDAVRPHRLLVAASGNGLQQIDLEPDLEITAQGPSDAIGYGRLVTLTYTVRNRGPFDATNVRTRIGLGSSAADVATTASNGSCVRDGTAVACTSRILRVDAVATITVTFTEPAAGSFRIPASVEAAQPDAVGGNNAADLDVVVDEVTDLAVTATGPSSVVEGNAATYTLTVANAGPNSATAVHVTFQPAAGVTLASVTPSTGSCSGTGPVTCSIASLPAAGSATISIATGTLGIGAFQSTFSVSSDGVDSVSTNNAGSIATTGTAKPAPPPTQSGGGGGGGMSLAALLGLLALALIREWWMPTRPVTI